MIAEFADKYNQSFKVRLKKYVKKTTIILPRCLNQYVVFLNFCAMIELQIKSSFLNLRALTINEHICLSDGFFDLLITPGSPASGHESTERL